jgi:hypothetical protein
MTENELTKRRPTPEPVGMGSYTIDSHNVQRYVTPDGSVQNEGDIGVGIAPYAIAYGALVPKKGQADNLLVPVCVSSSHIAFGSIRMEPVFMILGQSAATAAALAIDRNVAVQDVPYAALRARLLKDGQVLESATAAGKTGIDPKDLPGVVVDDDEAKLTGNWVASTANAGYVGRGYRHDGNARDGKAEARFEARLPRAGRYEVRITYPPNANRSTKVTVTVTHAGGTERVTIDQTKRPAELFVPLGTFDFAAGPAAVVVTNAGADGYVVIDAVQWLPK